MTRPSNLSFQINSKGAGKVPVKAAFLLQFIMDPSVKPATVRRHGKTYRCYYEHFPNDQQGAIECIGSFQQWEDGNNYVVIRPLRERIKG